MQLRGMQGPCTHVAGASEAAPWFCKPHVPGAGPMPVPRPVGSVRADRRRGHPSPRAGIFIGALLALSPHISLLADSPVGFEVHFPFMCGWGNCNSALVCAAANFNKKEPTFMGGALAPAIAT